MYTQTHEGENAIFRRTVNINGAYFDVLTDLALAQIANFNGQ